MIRLLLIASVGSFLTGLTSGGYIVHRWYRVDALQAQVKYLRLDRARFREALQIGEKVDDDTDKIEASNAEIEQAILKRAREMLGPVPDRICLNPEWVLSIGALK